MLSFFKRSRGTSSQRHTADLDQEIAFHVAKRAERLESQGLSREEAQRRALERFGDPAQVKKACVAERRRVLGRERRIAGLAGTLQDLRFGARTLRTNPGFAAAVIGILGVGIGATTAVFGVVNHVVLRPLAYTEPERLIAIEREHTRGQKSPAQLSPPDFAELRDRVAGAHVTALDESIILPLVGADRPIHVTVTPTLPDYFDVIGVRPILGRTFRPDEGIYSRDDGWPWRHIMLSYDLWQREFGGDEDILGRKLSLNNTDGEVVGVMPPGFLTLMPHSANTAEATDLWYPVQWEFRESRPDSARLRGLARLQPGVDLATVQAELDTLAAQLEQEYPYSQQVGKRFRAMALQSGVTEHAQGTLRTFAAGVGLVLLIACANVANLLLINGGRRQRDLAVRAALGASRTRLVRQMFGETAVLGGLAAALGVGLATTMIALLRAYPPRDLPRLAGLGIDGPTLSFAVLIAVAAVLIASLPPVLRSTQVGLRAASSRRTGTYDRNQRRAQGLLVIAEVALSIVLLAGAGLMLRTFAELQQVPLGFEHANLLTLNTTTITEYGEHRQATEDALIQGLSALPGVEKVGLGFPLPLNGLYDRSVPYRRAELGDDAVEGQVYFRTISPGYLEALSVDLLEGRNLMAEDNTREIGRVVIDERLAARTWPGESAIGKRLWMGEGFALDDWPGDYEVVGVVRYVPQGDHRDRQSTVYVSRHLYQSVELGVAIRTSGDPAQLATAARAVVNSVDPNMPVDVVPMSNLIVGSLASTRFALDVLSGFSLVALLLAAVGLYAVLAHGVRRRTREIGIRMALGAQAARVRRQVVARALGLATIGSVLGVSIAMVSGRMLENQLYGVTPSDPLTLAGTAAAVCALAVASSWLPARRAASVEPQTALRQD